jgi:hypothetical protein
MSDKDLIIELLGIAEVTEDGTVDFTDRAKEIIMDLAEKYRETPIYKKSKKETPEWVGSATAAEIYIQMCDRIVEAPTIMYMISSTKILIPILWKKIQEEEGKVYFRKTAAVGTTESLLNQMGEILES